MAVEVGVTRPKLTYQSWGFYVSLGIFISLADEHPASFLLSGDRLSIGEQLICNLLLFSTSPMSLNSLLNLADLVSDNKLHTFNTPRFTYHVYTSITIKRAHRWRSLEWGGKKAFILWSVPHSLQKGIEKVLFRYIVFMYLEVLFLWMKSAVAEEDRALVLRIIKNRGQAPGKSHRLKMWLGAVLLSIPWLRLSNQRVCYLSYSTSRRLFKAPCTKISNTLVIAV